MATERTFSILKPDATKRNLTGAVNAVIEKAGLRIVGQRRIQMSRAQAEKILRDPQGAPVLRRARGVHDLPVPWSFRCSRARTPSPSTVRSWGATNPANADAGTIRKTFSESVGENTVHGSDSLENAKAEIAQFFQDSDIVG